MSKARAIETRVGDIRFPVDLATARPYRAVVEHYQRETAPIAMKSKGPVAIEGWWWR